MEFHPVVGDLCAGLRYGEGRRGIGVEHRVRVVDVRVDPSVSHTCNDLQAPFFSAHRLMSERVCPLFTKS